MSIYPFELTNILNLFLNVLFSHGFSKELKRKSFVFIFAKNVKIFKDIFFLKLQIHDFPELVATLKDALSTLRELIFAFLGVFRENKFRKIRFCQKISNIPKKVKVY